MARKLVALSYSLPLFVLLLFYSVFFALPMLTQPVSILLVHPFALDATVWRTQLDALARKIRVIAPDLRGCGNNHCRPLFHCVEQYAKDVMTQLDHHDMQQAVVVGISSGAYVAMAIERLFPHRVAALLLANCVAGAETDNHKAKLDAFMSSIRHDGVGAVPAALLSRLVTCSCDDATRATLRDTLLRQNGYGLLAGLKALRNRPDATGGLKQVHCPTLVLAGTLDELVSPLQTMAVAQLVKGAEYREIQGAGHLLHLEAPEAFLQAIRDVYDWGVRFELQTRETKKQNSKFRTKLGRLVRTCKQVLRRTSQKILIR